MNAHIVTLCHISAIRHRLTKQPTINCIVKSIQSTFQARIPLHIVDFSAYKHARLEFVVVVVTLWRLLAGVAEYCDWFVQIEQKFRESFSGKW